MSTRVARLTESDWRMFARMRLRALTESLGENDPNYRAESTFTAAQWRRRLREHAQFAALVEERPVGLIAAQQQDSGSAYLYSLWLHPSARGRGLARRLVAASLDWARGCGVHTVRLRVAADNTAARGVYESLGFRVAPDETPDGRSEVAMTISVS
ncbi:GNAT family N-acetyltransferase [Mycobacterium sp. B14F4]|uniref:GNAT family N-acetyltransferase n=1 Tax=Mycobacterium sp. B14F4 TaxID=3153565 RepID=UPI00325EC339